jgi:hypothetical protein
MSKWIWSIALIGACLAATAPPSAAKPPDLPADPEINCPEGREPSERGRFGTELEPRNGRSEVEVEVRSPARAGAAPCLELDVLCPSLVPMLLERILQPGFETEAQDHRAAAATAVRDETEGQVAHGADDGPVAPTATAVQVETMFEIAERCRRDGDMARARTCYQETHLLAPTSRFGRLAVERLRQLELEVAAESATTQTESRREPYEELAEPREEPVNGHDSEGPDAESVYRRIRATTQPLGLVEPDSY